MKLGTVSRLSRYPVKSMLGEHPGHVAVGESGIRGDRAFGLLDTATGKVASAKDPRRWAGLLGFRATYDGADPGPDTVFVFEMPDGTTCRSDDSDLDGRLSEAIGRNVRLVSEAPNATYDMEFAAGSAPDDITEQMTKNERGRPMTAAPIAMEAPGTFQDVAPITLLTTGTLRHMAELHPEGDWDPDRFRSNLLIDTDDADLAENDWPGLRLQVGTVQLEVTMPTPRCVMTTLPQGVLERDRGIMRTIAGHNRREFAGLGLWACLGAYARVVEPGSLSLDDDVVVLDQRPGATGRNIEPEPGGH